MLSAEEEHARMRMGLAPSQYVAGKRDLLAEEARAGPLDLAAARDHLAPKLDRYRAKLLFDFCVQCGWVGRERKGT